MEIGDRVKVSTDDAFDGMVGSFVGIDPAGMVLVSFETDDTGPDENGPYLFQAIEVGVIE